MGVATGCGCKEVYRFPHTHTCQPMGGLMQDNIHNFAGHFNCFAGQIMKVIILLYLLIIKIITCNIVQVSEYTKKINQLYYQFPYEEVFV